MAAPQNIDEALLQLQADPPILVKDQSGQVGSQKTKYADLVQANKVILARLTELGVLWVTAPTLQLIPGQNGAQTPLFVIDWRLVHVESGSQVSGRYPLPSGANPQQNGSAITYARRYALVAVTNSVAEDDDDDGAGYRGRQGMAQRATARQQPRPEATAQRAAPAPRSERARPAEQPPLPERPVSSPPARVKAATKPMLTKLAIQFGEGELGKHVAGGIDKPMRLKMAGSLIQRQIGSFTELSFDEAKRLIDVVDDSLQRRDPVSYLRAVAHGKTPEPDAEHQGAMDDLERQVAADDALEGVVPDGK